VEITAPRRWAAQSMRSATHAQGNEQLTCAGCHERKGRAPTVTPASPRLAFAREPSKIRPEPEGSHPLSFPRLVQPVLEKHCLSCHGQQAREQPDLRRGNWQADTFLWYASYRHLRPYAFHYGTPRNDSLANQYDRWQPARTVPGQYGARASKLLNLLDRGHYDVCLEPEDCRRIIVWLDANSDFFGASEDAAAQARGAPVRARLD
jgi:hypothetical protein